VNRTLGLICLLAAATSVLSAQSGPAPSREATPVPAPDVRDSALARVQVERITRVLLDNDLFALRDTGAATDFDYTHGMGVEMHWASAPASIRKRLRNSPGCAQAADRTSGCAMFTLTVRQAIYTPASNRSVPVPGQRPHAGYLGVGARVSHATATRLRSAHVELGTTGKLALAEPLQQLIHALTGTARELGWRNQIGTRPTLLLRYDDAVVRDARVGRAFVRSKPHITLQLGNVRTSASVGAEVQLSLNRARFWTPYDGGAALPLGPYIVGGVQQDYVVRDVFVDGHFGDESITSVRLPNVSTTLVGFGWRFPGGTSEYRYVRRGKEYEAQTAVHSHGAFAFTFYRQ
jgi:hypothetical protein